MTTARTADTAPRPGSVPTVTAVIALLKAAGFQHSRYTERRSAPVHSGFYVRKDRPGRIYVVYREGDRDFMERMRAGGHTDPAKIPDSPLKAVRAREYADVLAHRYTVEITDSGALYLTARPALAARPRGVPRAAAVRRALTDAGIRARLLSCVTVLDQPDHTRVSVHAEEPEGPVADALTAQGWVFETSETSQHVVFTITGSAPDRRERLRRLRAQRETAPQEAGQDTPQERAPLGAYVAWAEGPQERTEHGYVVAARGDDDVLVLGLDGGFRQMPAAIPEEEPEPAAGDTPVTAACGHGGARYVPGMRVTYRTRDGFWLHGSVEQIVSTAQGPAVVFTPDTREVAPPRRGNPLMPHKRRPRPETGGQAMQVPAGDRNLTREQTAWPKGGTQR